ncbi:Response regulator protein vraR [Nocardia cyriacigeorgica]|uniref:Response regulator protein vraR n=1 Tax=Nocardia cyriacigeorgica TaxID=135487 RepID=A0A4U8WEL1_9NOCA|nr:Response regulator protein vraR [Nocardia cyriacigeorgica]
MTIRVLVADDQALVRGGFVALLDAQDGIEVVGEADNGEQAVRMTRALTPDVVLMDIRMPLLDGLAATRMIADDPKLSEVRVVVLTTFELDEYVFEAMRSGPPDSSSNTPSPPTWCARSVWSPPAMPCCPPALPAA